LPLLRRRINKLKKYTTRCRKMRKSEIQRAAKTEAAGVVRKTVEYGMNFYRYLPGCLERQAKYKGNYYLFVPDSSLNNTTSISFTFLNLVSLVIKISVLFKIADAIWRASGVLIL